MVLNWIKDFLTDRKQYVSINSHQSEGVNVNSGVPQGSVIGPILFVYYINDLPECTTSNIRIFADDTKAFSAINCIEDSFKLQKCIDSLIDWSKDWLLKFNAGKCKVLHLGKNNPRYSYAVGDQKDITLEESTCERDLGVHVDTCLNFENHISIT